MKVLFVFREEYDFPNYVVRAQAEALSNLGIDIKCYPILKAGLSGYLSALFNIREIVRSYKADLLHAHYNISGFFSALNSPVPVVASLMGSDIHDVGVTVRIINKIFHHFFWSGTIVKSKRMFDALGEDHVAVIPNGVNFSTFYPYDKMEARERVGFKKKYNIIFVSVSIHEVRKQLFLAEEAISRLDKYEIEFHIINKVEHIRLNDFYNAADLLLLTSDSEGSPNVIKEAMACNCPIVATDVGDVKEIIGNTDGCFVTTFDLRNIADKIEIVLKKNSRTNGRNNILHLESKVIAKKIVNVYEKALL